MQHPRVRKVHRRTVLTCSGIAVVVGALVACSGSDGSPDSGIQAGGDERASESTSTAEANTHSAPTPVSVPELRIPNPGGEDRAPGPDCVVPPAESEVGNLIQAGYDMARQLLPAEGLSFSSAGGEWFPPACKVRLVIYGVADIDQPAVETLLRERLGERYAVQATSARVANF